MKKDELLSYILILVVILVCYTYRKLDYHKFPSNIEVNCSKNINYYECKMALGKKVKLHELSAYELELIPKISERLSKKIIDYRKKVKNIEDLKKIRGIGDKTFLRLEKYLYIKEAGAGP